MITLPELEGAAEPVTPKAPGGEPASNKGRAGAKSITKEQVVTALRHYGGNVTRAAKALGVGRTVMYELMDRYGLRGGDPTP